MVTIGYPVTQNIKKCYLLHGCEATYSSSQVCEFRWVKVMEKMPCIGDFYWLIKFTERLLESRREKVVVSVLAMNAAAFFSFSCGIFNIKLGNV